MGSRNLSWAEAGSGGGEGPPLLLIHGAASSHLVWGAQLRSLSVRGRVLALDLPGHGRSDPPGEATIEGYREACLGFLEALGMERVVLVGHSMGGAIALSLALARPDLVASLVLVATGARLRVAPAILSGLLADREGTARIVVANSLSARAGEELRQRSLAEFLSCPAPVAAADFAACDAFDVSERLSGLPVPTLVVSGSEDLLTPARRTDFLVAAIPGARAARIEGAGHSVMIERPEVVDRVVLEFLGGGP